MLIIEGNLAFQEERATFKAAYDCEFDGYETNDCHILIWLFTEEAHLAFKLTWCNK